MTEFLQALGLYLGVNNGIVCAVGAGGKKSLLYAIAKQAEGRVALTSSVHMAPYPADLNAQVVVDEQANLLAHTSQFKHATRLAYAQPSTKANRLAGLSSEAINTIHQIGNFDLTLVKADGARGRHIKAPMPGEPVVVGGTGQVFAVVSIAALGRPLDCAQAHRPERLATLLGVSLGTRLTPEHYVKFLTHPQGALQAVGDARLCIVINQIDTTEQEHMAAAIAEQAVSECAKIERVVLTQLHPRPRVLDLIMPRAAK